jgi:hypothetical protein
MISCDLCLQFTQLHLHVLCCISCYICHQPSALFNSSFSVAFSNQCRLSIVLRHLLMDNYNSLLFVTFVSRSYIHIKYFLAFFVQPILLSSQTKRFTTSMKGLQAALICGRSF